MYGLVGFSRDLPFAGAIPRREYANPLSLGKTTALYSLMEGGDFSERRHQPPDRVWKELRDDIDWVGRERGNFQGLIGEREIASVYRVGPPQASFLGCYFKDASLHQLV